ncbi:F-box domain-containing protein [Mycena venus]|uniref:F-box domain-containing protein n=1 Tax=Mycena venus TaxID=2733690 RepID=A0A8H7CZG4_9AGAR|nr:F-box domain-containing protein [Mycena venus]
MASVLSQCVDCGKTHPPRAALNRSPFDSLLSRQNFPNASESAAIRDFLQDTDAEIASRERTIDRLLCEVAELRRRSDYHKAVIAPIRRVPPEVMAEIFLHLTAIEAKAGSDWRQCAQEERLFRQEYMVRPIVHKAPLVFCEISRKWRCIAISTPSLWYSLSLRCGNKKTPTGNSLCEMWLQRSGSLPLSIRLYPQPSRFWERRKIIDDSEDIMKTILSVAKRWRFLDLDGLPASSYNVLRGHLPDSVPMLETLFVRHRQRPPFAEIARLTPWAGLCGAPKLLRLYIDTICEANIMGQGEQSTFSWSRLTHINGGTAQSTTASNFWPEHRWRSPAGSVLQGPPPHITLRYYITHFRLSKSKSMVAPVLTLGGAALPALSFLLFPSIQT